MIDVNRSLLQTSRGHQRLPGDRAVTSLNARLISGLLGSLKQGRISARPALGHDALREEVGS